MTSITSKNYERTETDIYIPVTYDSLNLRKSKFIKIQGMYSDLNIEGFTDNTLAYALWFWNEPIIFKGTNIIQPQTLYNNSQSYYLAESFEKVPVDALAEYRYIAYVYPYFNFGDFYRTGSQQLTLDEIKELTGLSDATAFQTPNSSDNEYIIKAFEKIFGGRNLPSGTNATHMVVGDCINSYFNISDTQIGKSSTTTELFQYLPTYEAFREHFKRAMNETGAFDFESQFPFVYVHGASMNNEYTLKFAVTPSFLNGYPTDTGSTYTCIYPFSKYLVPNDTSVRNAYLASYRHGCYVIIGVEKI